VTGVTPRIYTFLFVNRHHHHHVYTRFSSTLDYSSGTLSVSLSGIVGTPTREERSATLTSNLLVTDNGHTAARVVALDVSAHKRRTRQVAAPDLWHTTCLLPQHWHGEDMTSPSFRPDTVALELFLSTIRVLIPLTMGKSEIEATIEMIETCDLQMVKRRKVFPAKQYAVSNRFLRVVTRVCLALADRLTPYRMLQTFNKTSYLVFKISRDIIPESTNSNRRHLIGQSV
jgi:hypothetical protein